MKEDHEALRSELQAAWSAGDLARAGQICQAHSEAIVEAIEEWQALPVRLGMSGDDLTRFMEFLTWTARFLADECGTEAALMKLAGLDQGPLGEWTEGIAAAVELGNRAQWPEAAKRLTALRDQLRRWSGPGVISYYATTCELLGRALAQSRRYEQAMAALREAIASWEKIQATDRVASCRDFHAQVRRVMRGRR
jgi:hypothetical protein